MERVWDSAVVRVELFGGWFRRWERREGMNARENEAIAPVDKLELSWKWIREMERELCIPERKADVAIGAAYSGEL